MSGLGVAFDGLAHPAQECPKPRGQNIEYKRRGQNTLQPPPKIVCVPGSLLGSLSHLHWRLLDTLQIFLVLLQLLAGRCDTFRNFVILLVPKPQSRRGQLGLAFLQPHQLPVQVHNPLVHHLGGLQLSSACLLRLVYLLLEHPGLPLLPLQSSLRLSQLGCVAVHGVLRLVPSCLEAVYPGPLVPQFLLYGGDQGLSLLPALRIEALVL